VGGLFKAGFRWAKRKKAIIARTMAPEARLIQKSALLTRLPRFDRRAARQANRTGPLTGGFLGERGNRSGPEGRRRRRAHEIAPSRAPARYLGA
jgi:hypothetical protein